MVRVSREPVSQHLRVGSGTSLPGVFLLLQHQHCCPLAHHEPVSAGKRISGVGVYYTYGQQLVPQHCGIVSRAGLFGPGLRLSKCFGPISGLHTNVFRNHGRFFRQLLLNQSS